MRSWLSAGLGNPKSRGPRVTDSAQAPCPTSGSQHPLAYKYKLSLGRGQQGSPSFGQPCQFVLLSLHRNPVVTPERPFFTCVPCVDVYLCPEHLSWISIVVHLPVKDLVCSRQLVFYLKPSILPDVITAAP